MIIHRRLYHRMPELSSSYLIGGFLRHFSNGVAVSSNSVRSRQGVLENTDFGGEKGEQDEERRNSHKRRNGDFGRFTRCITLIESIDFIKICDRRGNKENGDVDPIRGSANDAVVRIEDHRNQDQTQKNSAQLYAPKIGSVTKEKALNDRKKEHWPKE